MTEPFQIGGSLVQVGGRIDTKFDFAVGRLTYGWAFVKTEKWDARLKAGVHWAAVDVGLKLSGGVVDAETGDPILGGSTADEGGEVASPLPHLGLSAAYTITPQVVVRTQLLGFGLSIDDYSGYLIDAGADVVYAPWKHIAFGAGLRYFNLNLEAAAGRLNGEVDFSYWGPTLFGMVTF